MATDLVALERKVEVLRAELLAKSDLRRHLDGSRAIFYASPNYTGRSFSLQRSQPSGTFVNFAARASSLLPNGPVNSYDISPQIALRVKYAFPKLGGEVSSDGVQLRDTSISRRWTRPPSDDPAARSPEDPTFWQIVAVHFKDETGYAQLLVDISRLEEELSTAEQSLASAGAEGLQPSRAELHRPFLPSAIPALSSVFVPAFVLRAFAALSSLLGEEKRAAAADLVRQGREMNTSDAARRLFSYAFENGRGYPGPDAQREVFGLTDHVRIGLMWISQSLQAEEATEDKLTNWEAWSGVMRAYCVGGVRVWHITDLVSPSYMYSIEGGMAVRYEIGSWESPRFIFSGEGGSEEGDAVVDESIGRLLLPGAFDGERLIVPMESIVPPSGELSHRVDARRYLGEREDDVSVLTEGAQFGVDWEGSRRGNAHILRNTAAVAWGISGGKQRVFSGLYFKDSRDLVAIATCGVLKGGKMVDFISGSDSGSSEKETTRNGKAVQWVYEKLAELAGEARSGRTIIRKKHVELVSKLRRDICREIARKGLLYENENGILRWFGLKDDGKGLCVRAVARIADGWSERVGYGADKLMVAQDGDFVIRTDEIIGELKSMSEVGSRIGDLGVLVVLACVEAGMVEIKGLQSGYASVANNGTIVRGGAIMNGDVGVKYKFVFTLTDEVMVDKDGFGSPCGKRLVVRDGGRAVLSDVFSKCKHDSVVSVPFELRNVLVS